MSKNDEHILKERAKAIAVKLKLTRHSTEGTAIVEFSLFPEKYAIEARYIREVLTIKQITSIPGTPDYVMGVINCRGKIISVINLKVLLGLKEKGLTEMNKALLLASDEMEFGLIVDSIIGSTEIMDEQLASPPLTLSSRGAEFLSGITNTGSILLDAERMLASEQLIVNS
jgi:purine-binding chemotaxis protein CheW